MKPSQERMVFSMSILETKNLKKYYGTEPNITKALDGVTLTVEQGEFVAIVGTSGSGKSTLLNMMGGLDVPTSGNVKVKGKDLSGLNDEQLTIFRRRNIGFIFQNYNLVPVLNVYENIVLPVELDGDTVDKNFMDEVVHMAKVLINENTDTIRSTGFAKFYMPTDVFLPLCEQPHLVSFPFNVVDGMEADMEEFLSSYVEDIEPSMNYDSKQTYINSFNDLTSLIITIGGALSIIIGLIGITNFVNSVLTSIITRRKELAMLQSIGMTGKQLKKMLSFEGLYYAAGTVVASIVFGSLVSVIIVRAISNSIWFFTYKFVIFPMFVIYPFLIALTVIIPAIIYRKIAKTSIIERLHQN